MNLYTGNKKYFLLKEFQSELVQRSEQWTVNSEHFRIDLLKQNIYLGIEKHSQHTWCSHRIFFFFNFVCVNIFRTGNLLQFIFILKAWHCITIRKTFHEWNLWKFLLSSLEFSMWMYCKLVTIETINNTIFVRRLKCVKKKNHL